MSDAQRKALGATLDDLEARLKSGQCSARFALAAAALAGGQSVAHAVPLETWLKAPRKEAMRVRYAEIFYSEIGSAYQATLFDNGEAGIGHGASIEEAAVDALNDVMRREGAKR